jgi:hypothetical protein
MGRMTRARQALAGLALAILAAAPQAICEQKITLE